MDQDFLVTLQNLIDFVLADLARFNDKEVARIHDQHLSANLRTGQHNPVHAIYDAASPVPPSQEPVISQLASMRSKNSEAEMCFASI